MTKCLYCKKEFEGNKKARFCSAKCRVYWNRNNEKGKIVTDPLRDMKSTRDKIEKIRKRLGLLDIKKWLRKKSSKS